MSGYSLWTEPWIPVQTLSGHADKVSLAQALTQAHTLRGVLDPSPLVTVGLHRLLLALLYRIHHPRRFPDWQAVWEVGRFDERAILDYGEQWAEKFDLLHPSRPFYQVPHMPGERVHPVAALLLEGASGNNPAIFDHGLVEGAAELPLDRAACYLLAHQLFALGGGVSKPFNRMDAPLTKGIVVEVVGRSLFETLMFNHMPEGHWAELTPPTPGDKPFWEEASPPAPDKNGTPVKGPLHYLTWQSRQLHLVMDRDRRVVVGCQIAQRYCLPKDGSRFDPGKSYYTDEKKETGYLPRRLQKDRAAWRLTHVLLQPVTTDKVPPEVVEWLTALRQKADELGSIELPHAISLAVSGLTTDPKLAAKIDLWRREEIGLPLAILEDRRLVQRMEKMMQLAGWVEGVLRRAGEALVWTLTERKSQAHARAYLLTGKTGAKIPPSVAPVARSLGTTLRYWAAMEAPFRGALRRLPGPEANAEAEWIEALRQTALAAFATSVESMKRSGASWESLAVIQDAFNRALIRTLKAGEEEKHDDGEDEEDD